MSKQKCLFKKMKGRRAGRLKTSPVWGQVPVKGAGSKER
jgi:hypothetical protein